eukprot:IDg9755t1
MLTNTTIPTWKNASARHRARSVEVWSLLDHFENSLRLYRQAAYFTSYLNVKPYTTAHDNGRKGKTSPQSTFLIA